MTLRVVVMLAIVLLLGSIGVQAEQTEPRQVRRNGAQRIVDLVQPNELSLIVVESADPPLRVGPEPGTSLLAWICRLADAIVVVEISDRQSTLTARQDWVRSMVTASVLEAVKSPQGRALSAGDMISFTEEGGRVLVGGTEVTAVVPSVRPTQGGRRYLIFLNFYNEAFHADPEWTYETGDTGRLNRLSSTDSSNRGLDDVENASEAEVVVRIRELVANAR